MGYMDNLNNELLNKYENNLKNIKNLMDIYFPTYRLMTI
jgi:hypothetical protein